MATPGAESAVYDCLVIVRFYVKTDAAYCYNCFVAWFVCLLVTTKTDEQMEVPFRLWTRLGPGNYVLGADPDSSAGRDTWDHTWPSTADIVNFIL